MEYLIPLVLVLLLVAGFVTFMVLNATKKGGLAATGDEAPGIGPDETPLGDTTEHAGRQTDEGTTVRTPEGGGEPEPDDDPDAAAHRARPGEGEGRVRLEFDAEPPAARTPPAADRARDADEGGERFTREEDDEPAPPASERLANRDV